MRKNFGSKTWLFPMPVLIIATYDEKGNPDVMNAAWGGIVEENTIGICLSESHKTTKNIAVNKAFTVSVADARHVTEEDYVGIVSQNDDKGKFEKSGFTAEKSPFVNAPIIKELPMALECSYIKTTEDGLVMGKIVNVSCDEDYLTNGKIDPALLRPITFDPINAKYIELGSVVGNAFSDGKKLKK